MKHWTKTHPEQDVTGIDRRGKPYTHHFDTYSSIECPTLQQACLFLWRDFGPFDTTWTNDRLCPFHNDVGTKMVRCCEGHRRQRFCRTGHIINIRHIQHLPQPIQVFLADKVICYQWAFRLTDAYWSIPNSELLHLPDDIPFVSTVLLDKIYRLSGWYAWHNEHNRRLSTPKTQWLRPLPTRPFLSKNRAGK
jgi:hypothetical protein